MKKNNTAEYLLKRLSTTDGNLIDNDTLQAMKLLKMQVINFCKRVDDFQFSMWVKAQRSDFNELSKYLTEKDIRNFLLLGDGPEKAEDAYNMLYPNKEYWFLIHFYLLNNQLEVQIGDFVLSTVVTEIDDFRNLNLTDIVNWVSNEFNAVLKEIESGAYYERIEKELPLEYRIGYMSRAKYWEIKPEEKKKMLKDLTEEEIQEVISMLETNNMNFNDIHNMTFDKYLKMVSELYQCLGYDVQGMTLLQQNSFYGSGFAKIVEGIDKDSESDFNRYINREWNAEGKRWTILGGNSKDGLKLITYKYCNNYYFTIEGKIQDYVYEIVKTLLFLKKFGGRVHLISENILLSILKQEDNIGFVPKNEHPSIYEFLFDVPKVYEFHYLNKSQTEVINNLMIQPLKRLDIKQAENN